MTLIQEQISKTFNLMQERSEAPKLTPEQLNAIDLLIFGKTDREVAETIGVGRNTISKWYKNAFFIAELNSRREELWVESKLRLKALVNDAVNVLTNGLKSSDEKIKITAAVHILKTVGLYGEVNQSFGPDTPEETVWKQAVEQRTRNYMALRPDAFYEWSVKNQMEELSQEGTTEMMGYLYELAVDEQKKALRDYRKKHKDQVVPEMIPVPLSVDSESTKMEELIN